MSFAGGAQQRRAKGMLRMLLDAGDQQQCLVLGGCEVLERLAAFDRDAAACGAANRRHDSYGRRNDERNRYTHVSTSPPKTSGGTTASASAAANTSGV